MPNEIKYYRNLIPIETVEAESLWLLLDGFLVLVDDDEPVFLPADLFMKHFYQIASSSVVEK